MDELELTDHLFGELQDYIKARMLSANTFRTYSYALNKLFKDHKVLSQDNINKILSEKNKRGQYRYLNPNKRAIFNIINNYCLSKSIKFSLVIPVVAKKERVLTDIPTINEIKSMVEITPHPYSLMLRVIYNFGAGLRISEFVRLSWSSECINWNEWIDKRGGIKCLIKESKRGKSRYVTVPGDLMEDLYKYAKETVGFNEYGLPNSTGFMFDFDKGHFRTDLYNIDVEKWQIEYVRYVQRWIDYHILKKYSTKTIGRKIHIHQFRNSKASHLYNYENKPIEVIQELLGHKNIETTKIYVKISFDKIIKSMEGTQSI